MSCLKFLVRIVADNSDALNSCYSTHFKYPSTREKHQAVNFIF